MIIMLRCRSDLLRCIFFSFICLSHCDVNVSFLSTLVLLDLSCDIHQCPFVMANYIRCLLD